MGAGRRRRTSGCSGWGRRSLEALGRAAPVEALARYFEYWLLRLEGVYPAWTLPAVRPEFAAGAALVLAERSFVCAECAHGGPRLSADAMDF